MSALDRRRMLCLMSAMLPALASREVFAQARVGGISGTISPPPQPMVYTRRLVRSLVGNAQLMVERRFSVRFTASPTGYLVQGEQIAVAVETPEQLAALADLERQRVELGIFPLELDRRGWIRSGIDAEDVPEIEAALGYVSATLATLDRSDEELETMRNFVAAVHEAGSNIVSSLPIDLFAPVDGDRSDLRSIDLPGGDQGTVETRFTARRDPATGLMESARREVVTTIAQDERRTIEIFTLVS